MKLSSIMTAVWLATAGLCGGGAGCGSSSPAVTKPAVTTPAAEPPAAPADVIGTWTDESSSVYTIARGAGGQAEVTRAVDIDGEARTEIESGWNDQGQFWFKYFVPSTGYRVAIVFTAVNGDNVTYTWTNTDPEGNANSGTDAMTR